MIKKLGIAYIGGLALSDAVSMMVRTQSQAKAQQVFWMLSWHC